MTVVRWAGGHAIWWNAEVWTVLPWSYEAMESVRGLLAEPVTRYHSEETDDGTIGEVVETLAPGTRDHAVAALLTLPDASLVTDPEADMRSELRSTDPEEDRSEAT